MSEEIKKAYKLFNREDLIDDGYERDLDSNIQVFLTTKQMINYMNLQQKVEQLEKENKELKQPQVYIDCENMEERYGRDLYEDYLKEKIEQLENIRKEAIEATKDVKQFVYDELVDRNVSGATETHCKIMDLLNILNKGE